MATKIYLSIATNIAQTVKLPSIHHKKLIHTYLHTVDFTPVEGQTEVRQEQLPNLSPCVLSVPFMYSQTWDVD